MARSVGDDGPRSAQLVLVGEAPGAHEERAGRPFVGPSGWRLQEWWSGVGLSRRDFYITNVHRDRPPANKIEAVPTALLERDVDELHQRLDRLPNAVLVVPTGNIALRALMRRALRGQDAPKITEWRGSILRYVTLSGRKLKMIPTIHPAATFRDPTMERPCLHDWKRIAAERHDNKLRLPKRDHRVDPELYEIDAFIAEMEREPERWLAFDIETPGDRIACVGFASSPGLSLTIPTLRSRWRGRATIEEVWERIARLLHGPWPKVTQNGHFDYYWLGMKKGIRPINWRYDTLAMHHCLDATDQHSLDYMASIHTRQPYWKKEAKDPEEIAKYASNSHALWVYNGIDCCVTYELAEKFHALLVAREQLAFYHQHYRKLFKPTLDLMLHGIRVDSRARAWQHFCHQAARLEAQDKLAALAGAPLHAAKALSPVKLKHFLYTQLRLPKQISRKTGQPTTDKVALLKLAQLAAKLPEPHGPTAREGLATVLAERRHGKLLDFLNPAREDHDGRIRCTMKFTTETGRFASAKNPMRGGFNLQNQDRSIRAMFLPDE